MITATVAFVVLWCVAAAANMWVGVSHAGYSFREELPIFLLIFLLPSAVAVFVKWKCLCARGHTAWESIGWKRSVTA